MNWSFLPIQSSRYQQRYLHSGSNSYAPDLSRLKLQSALLAAQVSCLLHLQQVTFLPDNIAIAKAAASRDVNATQVHWEIYQIIFVFSESSANGTATSLKTPMALQQP
jgi:hypothetical protein